MNLPISHHELNLDYTLGCGQAFRWRKQADGSWAGIIPGRYARLRQRADGIECLVIPDDDWRKVLERYFRLDVDLAAVRRELAERDTHMGHLFERFSGLRLLKQDPTETLLSFICSAANSIPRIEVSVEKLALAYGRRICMLDGVCYHEFPSLDVFTKEQPHSVNCVAGLGFRCKTLNRVAAHLSDRPSGWLDSLSELPYEDAKRELVGIYGVGEKIADCVCLFGLAKDEAVPVDTHVRRLTQRLYLLDTTIKTVTPKLYRRISTFFRERFGMYAGWAQQYLYYEDLLRSRGSSVDR